MQMIDSGSSLLSLPCNTGASAARKCKAKSQYYTLKTKNLLTKTQCSSNTTGCFSSINGTCAWSSALTGGSGYNG